MATEPVLKGSCMCGAITYESTTLPTNFTNCHCKTCRKLSGSPFLTFAPFPLSTITWTSGQDSLKKTAYSDLAERTHCAECGSPISMQYKCEPEEIGITAGTIDEESVKGPLPKVSLHIFCKKGEKAGWYDLPDDKAPRYTKFSSGFQKRIDAWKNVLMAPGLG